jgi:hypothetical protein
MSDFYTRLIPIPGGAVRIKFYLANGNLHELDYHSSAKLRVRLESSDSRQWELHVYRGKKVLASWHIFVSGTEVEVSRTFINEAAWGSHRYGQGRLKRQPYVRTPSSPEGEAKAQAAQL